MRKLWLVVALIGLLAAACQSASEQLTEQILEQQDGVSDVDIDTDSGEVSIETEDGSISIGGGEIPGGFPIPFPDGYEVSSVFDTDSDTAVSATYPGDRYDEIVAFYDDWTSGQPGDWNRGSNTFDSAEGQTIRSTNWVESNIQIGATDCPSFDNDDEYQVCVSAVTGKG